MTEQFSEYWLQVLTACCSAKILVLAQAVAQPVSPRANAPQAFRNQMVTLQP
jgi:hypothetical protein